jgi:uncharacterized protein YjdB
MNQHGPARRKRQEIFMRDRSLLGALLLIGLVVPLTGCTNNSGLDAIQVSPATQSLTVGQSSQFTATGTFGNASHPSTKDVTTAVTWSSSTPSVATIDSGGIAAAVGGGTTTITATAAGFRGPVTSSATLTVTASSGGQTGGSVVSISVIPGSQSVASPSQTAQFIAIGTTSSGATENLTNAVLWSSSSTQIATIGVSTGLATGVSQGTSTITALYSNPANGTTVTGIATFTVVGGATQQYTAVAITPSSQSLSASGQTGQFIALATSGSTGLQVDVTSSSQITWSSSIPSVATISGSGLASGVGVGTTTITALLTNSDSSVVTATATISVSLTSAPEPLLSLTIIPSSITVDQLQDTGQFLAIGTYSTPPYVRDVTNEPTTTWISSAPSVFPVNTNSGGSPGATAGIVTAYGNGSAIIIAETSALDGTIQTATATFNCPMAEANPNGNPPEPATCLPGTQAPALLATLTVYNQGLNTTNWEVTAPSATGTPDVLHCGPGWALNGGAGGSVCVATYPVGTTVTLTAPAGAGAFGGWSYNCTAQGSVTAAGPNSCTVTLTTNDTVGAIFN